ncbi:MAG TPA: hydroxyacid dehydrogenase, partial [Hyphomicrobiaceae bacterium]|nr:hydroxyacid dehydrogenase [Hyphomicrobiaceae bacterium]
VRFNHWVHPDFVARIEHEPGVELITMDQHDDVAATAALSRAHVYQIASSRDELDLKWHAHADLLERAPHLLCISTGGAGFDTVDVAACTAAGVLVVNQAGGNARSVAEHTLGMMLDVSKRITETDRVMRTERGMPREDLMGHEISGRTIGIVGIGHVGRRVAALAKAFGMTVLATDPYVNPQKIAEYGATPVVLDELLEKSDFVSLHCPRDTTTIGMMNAEAFARMKQGSIFITTCRGGIHDETALHEAIQSGHLAGAGLDVWDIEPPPLDHPLLRCRNVVATFHTAGVTHEARGQMARFASDQAIEVLAGGYPPRAINPDVWPAYATRFERILGFKPAARPAS